MDISIGLVILACVACFFAGIMNASGGSGGLLSIPSLMLCGLDPHYAIGTNKVQAIMGLTVAVVRYIRGGFIHWQLAIPCVICGAGGAVAGANLSMLASDKLLIYLMFAALPLCAWVVLSKKGVSEERSEEVVVTPKLLATLGIIALVCGFYDGFYGPGSGTFLVVGLSLLTPLGVKTVSAHAKVINLCDNLAAFVVFLVNGRMVIWLGVLVGICSMVGAWIGAGAVMKSGAKIMKPLLLVALILLVINLITKF